MAKNILTELKESHGIITYLDGYCDRFKNDDGDRGLFANLYLKIRDQNIINNFKVDENELTLPYDFVKCGAYLCLNPNSACFK